MGAPLHFGEFWWMCPPLPLPVFWWIVSLLCTLVNFGEWGPPFAFWWMWCPFALWLIGSPLCTLVNGVPLCTLMNGSPLCTLVNGVPPLNFREFWRMLPLYCGEFCSMVSPLYFGEFWWMGYTFSLWWMESPLALWRILVNVVLPLCTLVNRTFPWHFVVIVNDVPPLHFGEWGPPFALWWMGSLLHFGKIWWMSSPFPIWWMGYPLHFCKWVPLFALWWILGSTICTFINGVPFALWWNRWMTSFLCTLVNGVSLYTLVNIGEWRPPFALTRVLVNGVPP